MDTTTPDDAEIDLEQIDDDEGDCELLDHESDDEVDPGYEDKLSEQILSRIRHRLPRNVVASGTVHDGYCEVLTERIELVNDHQVVDKVAAVLVSDDAVATEPALQGTLSSAFTCGQQLLELSYRFSTTGTQTTIVYAITLDGTWVHGFRSSALGLLAFDVLVDHHPDAFPELIQRLIDIFYTRGVARGEDRREVCTDDFCEEVYGTIAR